MSATMQNIFTSGAAPQQQAGPQGDPMMDRLKQLMMFQATHGSGVKRDANGMPIDPSAPQGLDAIRASQASAPQRYLEQQRGANELQRLMGLQYQNELQQRQAAGHNAVDVARKNQEAQSIFDQEQAPNSVRSNARGQSVAYRNGMPVGFSGFDSQPVISDPAERSMVNTKGLMLRPERQRLQDQIYATASMFDSTPVPQSPNRSAMSQTQAQPYRLSSVDTLKRMAANPLGAHQPPTSMPPNAGPPAPSKMFNFTNPFVKPKEKRDWVDSLFGLFSNEPNQFQIQASDEQEALAQLRHLLATLYSGQTAPTWK